MLVEIDQKGGSQRRYHVSTRFKFQPVSKGSSALIDSIKIQSHLLDYAIGCHMKWNIQTFAKRYKLLSIIAQCCCPNTSSSPAICKIDDKKTRTMQYYPPPIHTHTLQK